MNIVVHMHDYVFSMGIIFGQPTSDTLPDDWISTLRVRFYHKSLIEWLTNADRIRCRD